MNNEEKILSILETVVIRLDRIETKVDALDTRLSSLETKVDALDTRITALETKVDALDTRLSSIETKVGTLESKVDAIAVVQADMKAILSAVFEHTAVLAESQTVTDRAVKELNAITKETAIDVLKLRAAR